MPSTKKLIERALKATKSSCPFDQKSRLDRQPRVIAIVTKNMQEQGSNHFY